MRHSIVWRLSFRVKDLRKAQGRIEAVRQAFNLDVEVLTCEQYWKIPELWDCTLKTPKMEKPIAEAAFDCLLLANTLANGWQLSGPLVRQGVLTVFSGVYAFKGTMGPYVAGLEWGSFDLNAE